MSKARNLAAFVANVLGVGGGVSNVLTALGFVSTPAQIDRARAKAFLRCSNNGGVANLKSFNVASVVRQAVGVVDVTLTAPLDSTLNIAVASSVSPQVCCGTAMLNASNIRVTTRITTTGADVDQEFSLVVFGDLA